MLAHKPVFGSEDFRQYGYCPRKIFFRWVMYVSFPPTAKMKRGLAKHEEAVNTQIKLMKSFEDDQESSSKL